MGEASLTGNSGMPLTVNPVPSGAKSVYAYDFPIKPGQTRFDVFYKLPYSGSYEYSFTPDTPLDEVGILLPKSMKFAGVSPGFVQDRDEAGLNVYFVKNAAANQPVKFSVSGEGLIGNAATTAGEGQPASGGSAPAPSSSGGSSGVLWFVGSAIVILIGGAVFVLWRRSETVKADSGSKNAKPAGKARAQAQGQPAKSEPADMLEVLKDELFQLETDRLNGKISQDEYDKTKAGLDTLFRRQMKRK